MLNVAKSSVAVMILVAGCTSSSSPAIDPPGPAARAEEPVQVTLHVAGMNQRLKIL